jgi:2,4-dienoyl-CoA reductase-like NADH-dependent reductase (Old Yellow Enzyme family)
MKNNSVAPLFTPFELGSLRLENRWVMAPMTRTQSPAGVPTEKVSAYYERRAAHGVGLILTEGTTIDHPVATYHPDVPRFHGAAALAGWQGVVTAVHAAGGRIFPQLWHVGSARKPGTPPFPEAQSIGPSGLIAPGKKRAREMSESDIADVIAAYAKAARTAQALHFDGVELHGAHGYLIDQFFWSGTNERALPWGGEMVARTHFAAEVVRAVRREVGAAFPICLRFSQWKLQDFKAKLAETPAELEQFLAPLVDAGVDLFHASTRRFWLPEFADSDLNLAGWTKRLTGKPVITVGSVGLDGEFQAAFAGEAAPTRKLDDLVERFERGEFDLVAVGRAVLQDPSWVEKVGQRRFDELRAFDPASMRELY